MTRRERWKAVLDAELKHWSKMPFEQLKFSLNEARCYEVEYERQTYQVEVSVVDQAENYIRVSIGVDDGSLPASICPVTGSFVQYKGGS